MDGLKDLKKAIGEKMLRNLRAASNDAGAQEREVGSTKPGEAMYLQHVLKPATLAMVKGLPPREQSVADRWACTEPEQLRKLEVRGQLAAQLELQAKAEFEALSDARVAGRHGDLPESEILELWGLDQDLHLYP
jgi:hypothetical protein